MVIRYVAGMSEDVKRVCKKFNIRVVFKSGWTLCPRSRIRYLLVSNPMWYIVSPAAAARYIGETRRRPEMRLKEHRDAYKKCTAKGNLPPLIVGGMSTDVTEDSSRSP